MGPNSWSFEVLCCDSSGLFSNTRLEHLLKDGMTAVDLFE
jgi:hypothetical protein